MTGTAPVTCRTELIKTVPGSLSGKNRRRYPENESAEKLLEEYGHFIRDLFDQPQIAFYQAHHRHIFNTSRV